MGKILTTELHSFFSHKFINQNEHNYQIIDNWLSDFKNEIEDHIKNQNPAHDATQIKYEAGSVSEFLEYLNGRFSNMILGHNGNGINEVTDARVDNNGVAHATLQDRLRNDNVYYKEKIKTINEEVTENYKEFQENEYRFDPKEQEMQFITDLSPYYNAVMQSFWVDPNTYIIYMTQAHGNGKDYVLTRLKPNGQFIDRAMVKNGGHGSHNAYRYEKGQLWIYSHIYDDAGKHRFVKFKYKSGEIKYGSGTIEVLPNHTYDKYVTAVYNPNEDLFILRIANSDEEFKKTNILNRLEFIKGVDVDDNNANVINKFDIPFEYTSKIQPFQGMTYDDGILYIYTGDSDPSVSNYLHAFNPKTKEKLWSRVADIGGISNDYYGNFQEAEGVSMYYDKETGRKAILLGVTTGPGNNRHHSIFAVGQRGVNEILKNRISPVLMTDTGGRVKPLPQKSIAKLSDATEIGHYYLYTNDTLTTADFPLPTDYRNAGWFLDVYPGHYNGALRQVLTRNSTGRNILKFERVISVFDSKLNGPWNYINETAGFWEKIPQTVKKLEDVNFAGMTFYISTEDSKRFSDFPSSFKGIAGWTLEIEQVSEGVRRQVLKRNNYESNYQILVRTISTRGKSKWNLIEGKEID
ncbi:hypothetical protein BUZ54_07505 [Staphylococcus hominis]|uniref:phage baseplate protein n=1 Tax=Staphylococcus hominis TaxID=1290 RepID=UPI000D1E37E1|nr:hypothetical protein [Staphylococcus hominis]PTK25106.1 hypothetical protein BUZ54_07505 [Staphylococcus hominis]